MKTEKKKTFLHPFIISIRGKDVNKREKYARNAPYSQNSLSIYINCLPFPKRNFMCHHCKDNKEFEILRLSQKGRELKL